MKRINFLMVAMLFALCRVMAVPAHPGIVKIQQPDGTSVSIRLIGDEWLHFNTTSDGYSVVKDSRGYYVYAELKDGVLQPTAQVAHDLAERSASELDFLAGVKKYQAPAMSEQMASMKQNVEKRQKQVLSEHRASYDYSHFRGLIILVQFTDKKFSRDDYDKIINQMVNAINYDGYENTSGKKEQYTGSVRDYFSDNSDGKFQPQFDVVGPFTVNYSQYDPNATSDCAKIVKAAIEAADPSVNFKDYDGDGDGIVDLVYFMIAGNGSNYNGNDGRLWWPHRSTVYDPATWKAIQKDGVYFRDYASSVELYGWLSQLSTVTIDGIGTICHEFSHVLGLPDFYDTDYAGSGGLSNHPGIWSVMAGGSYENTARTPVGYSLYERYAVGFTEEPEIINQAGDYELGPVSSTFTGLRIDSPVDKEFFLLENRQKSFKWDAYLPGSGMLVYRVDFTDPSVWSMSGANANKVNANPAHNYYELVRADGPHKDTNGYISTAGDVFPGSKKVTELNNTTEPANLLTWAGKETKWGLTNIKMQGEKITFTIEDTYVLRELILPETAKVGVGMSRNLEYVATPSYAHYKLAWTSDNEAVATVNQEGKVTGVSEGSCKIKVTSDNGCVATCTVTVESLQAVDLDELKKEDVDTEALLQLTDAEVLYVYENTAYVRDAKGSIMFNNTGLNLQRNDVLNGSVYVKLGQENGMFQVVGVEGLTDATDLTVAEGAEVQPRNVKLEDLTADDYSDYIIVKGVQVIKNNGAWAVSGDKRARLWNKFQDKSISMKNYDGKYFDIPAIFGTDVLDGEVISELYMVKSPVEVADPSAIRVVNTDATKADAPLYNLQGQRVDRSVKGLLIRNGKKYVNR